MKILNDMQLESNSNLIQLDSNSWIQLNSNLIQFTSTIGLRFT